MDKFIAPPKPQRTVMAIPGASGDSAAMCYMPLGTPRGLLQHSPSPHPTPSPHGLGMGRDSRSFPIILSTPSMSSGYTPKHTLTAESSEDTVEGFLVEKALQNLVSLPEAVTELASKSKDQAEELSRQKAILTHLKEKLAEEEQRRDSMSTERASIKRRTYLAEESTHSKAETCSTLRKDLAVVAVRATRLRGEVAELTEQIDHDEQLYRQYREKMTTHENLVAESECDRPLRVQLNQLTEAVHKLEDREKDLAGDSVAAHHLMDGVQEGELRATLTQLEEQQALVLEDLKARREMLKKEKEKQQKTRQDIDVLCRRNAAQLTRLRAQVREAQVRNRHCGEQASELEQGIASLQEQLVSSLPP